MRISARLGQWNYGWEWIPEEHEITILLVFVAWRAIISIPLLFHCDT
jgi:hypothetical protein